MQIPASHARLAILGDDLVVFDLRADRYIALPGAVSTEARGAGNEPLAARLAPDAAAVLSEAGLLVDGDAEDACRLLLPASTLPPAIRRAVRIRDVVFLGIALLRTAWRLSRGRHCSSFPLNRRGPIPSVAHGAYADAISRLATIRLLIPTPGRCLPAALVTGIALKMQGLETEIVFGVRSHPFEAHCWLQRGTMIIDDDLDRVRSYTPIAAGLL